MLVETLAVLELLMLDRVRVLQPSLPALLRIAHMLGVLFSVNVTCVVRLFLRLLL